MVWRALEEFDWRLDCPILRTQQEARQAASLRMGFSFRLWHASDLLELTAPIQFFHEVSRIAPAGFDFDEEFEKDFGPDHLLDVEACVGSNLLEHLAAFAEQDGFLAVAFAKNHSGNSRHPRTLFELLDQH